MQIEVLALFQKELKEEIASIEALLPRFGKETQVKNDLSRIFHSMKGASSLIKIDAIRSASAFFEKRMNEEIIKDEKVLLEGIETFISLMKEVLNVKEEKLLETIKLNEERFYHLEIAFAFKEEVAKKAFDEKKEHQEITSRLVNTLKEIMGHFKQHLSFCETDFDDHERLMLLEELSTEIRDLGKESGVPLIHEAGKALNLCFFAARKKLLGWTRGHFDLITEIVEYLTAFSLQEEENARWLKADKKNIETCIGIILAISNEATQFIQQDLGSKKGLVITLLPATSITNEPSEKDLRFLGLFISELSDQIKDFEKDLLLLEKMPGDKNIASKLMRASHSLKGSAKAVEFGLLTRLAHAMEDIFSMVQNGDGKVSSETVDILFNASDLLNSLSKTEAVHLNLWLSSNRERIEKIINDLGIAYVSCSDESPLKNLTKEPEVLDKVKTPQEMPVPADDKRFLRLSLSHINQLMGIAGEFLVEGRSLETIERGLDKLKVKACVLESDLGNHIENLKRNPTLQRISSAKDLHADVKNHVDDIITLRSEFDRFARTSETLSTKFYQEMLQSRMRPFSEGAEFLPRLIRDLCKQLGKKAKLEIHGKDTLVDREILEKLETPLTHLVRNAIDHGIEPDFQRAEKGKPEVGTIKLEVKHQSGSLVISVSDDGAGIDLETVKRTILEKKLSHESLIEKMDDEELLGFLYHPGFSTHKDVTDISGRGIGLNIVISAVEQLGGKVTISRGEWTSFTMQLPITLSIIRALIVKIAGEPYAFPLTKIKKVLYLSTEEVIQMEGRKYFKEGKTNIGLIPSDEILGFSKEKSFQGRIPVVVIVDDLNDYGIAVDSFLGEREIAIHELDKKLGKVETISAGSFMEDGSPLLILDVDGLKKCIDRYILC